MSFPPGPYGIVSDAYTSSKSYANDMIQLATDAVTDLANVSLPNNPIEYSPSAPTVGVPAPNFTPVSIDIGEYALNINYDPGTPPTVGNISTINFNSVPNANDFFGSAPTVDYVPKPQDLSATVPQLVDAPVFDTKPVAPTYSLPSVPELRTLELPEDIVFVPVEFDAVAPNFDLVIPDTHISYSEDLYTSPLMEAYTDILMRDLEQGATGLHPDVEDAIWDRARTREEKNTRNLKNEAVIAFSRRGFTMPSGVLSAKLAEADRLALDATSTINRDIAIKQAEMAVENAKVALQAAIQTEGQMITYVGFMAQRAFDLAKSNAQLLIDSFKLRLESYNTQMQSYATEAQVFKQLIEAEVSRANFHRIQLEAVQIKGQLNTQDIAVYEAQLRGVQTLTDVYKTQVSAYAAFNDAEKSKIDVFKAQVDAFSAQVGAKTEEYKAYSAQIEAETTKVQSYTAQVGAYKTAVDGYQAYVSAEVSKQTSEIETAKLNITAYEAKIKRYISELDAEAKRLDAVSKKDSALIGISKSVAELDTSVMEANITTNKANSEIAISNAKGAVAAASASAQLSLQASKLQSEAFSTTAKVAGQLAASAMTVTNTSASISGADSTSVSHSHTYKEK